MIHPKGKKASAAQKATTSSITMPLRNCVDEAQAIYMVRSCGKLMQVAYMTLINATLTVIE